MKNFQRQKKNVHRFQQRAGCTEPHHLQPSSRGGEGIDSNLLNMDVYRHDAWHLLFKNSTLEEIIELLQRLKLIKTKQKRRELL